MNANMRALTQALEHTSTAIRALAEGHPNDARQVTDPIHWAHELLSEVLNIAFPVRVEPEPIADPYSSDVPIGYDTVLGYLSKQRPELLDLFDDPISETQRDGWWLGHRCRTEGLTAIKVVASAACQAVGIAEVNAYPVDLLERRFG